MNFCNQCGSAVSHRVPTGDNRPRYICDDCDHIHYQNPRIIAGCLPIHGSQVLLCKRAIEPRKGWWTLPAGFLENGETTAQGALRETREEANANAEIIEIYTMFSLPHINQVHLFYLADLLDENFGPTSESMEVKLFSKDEILWNELAFPTVERTLKYYIEDSENNDFIFREEDITLWK